MPCEARSDAFSRSTVADELGAKIVAGGCKAGVRLVELDLAQTFGISRGRISEAIRILERRRLVELLPRRGAYVGPLSMKSIAYLFNVRIAPSLLAMRTMATAPIESYVETHARRCAELNEMVETGDPIAFARVTTRRSKRPPTARATNFWSST